MRLLFRMFALVLILFLVSAAVFAESGKGIDLQINWELIAASVFIVVGVLEWLKGFITLKKTLYWRIVMVALCFALAFSLQYLPSFIIVALLVLAGAQLGYQVIVEFVKKKLGGG